MADPKAKNAPAKDQRHVWRWLGDPLPKKGLKAKQMMKAMDQTLDSQDETSPAQTLRQNPNSAL